MSTETSTTGRTLIETVINKIKSNTFNAEISNGDWGLYNAAIDEAPKSLPINAFTVELNNDSVNNRFYLNGEAHSIYFLDSPMEIDICDYKDFLDHLPAEFIDKIIISFIHSEYPIKFFYRRESDKVEDFYLFPFAGRMYNRKNL